MPYVSSTRFPNAGHFYSNIVKPIKIDLNFIVDSTNGNGLGIRSLKSNGYVRNVFMHTSATPGSNDGALNPNPASGYALIQLKQNFNYYLGGFSGFVSPVSGTPLTSTTSGGAYIIVSLGTAAAWPNGKRLEFVQDLHQQSECLLLQNKRLLLVEVLLLKLLQYQVLLQ